MHDAPIYGRIAALKLFRPRGESQDLLFILTKQCKFCILQWDATTLDFITRVMGDVSVPNACPTGNKIATISPDGRLIGLHLYDGLFTVIPFDNGKAKEAFNMRLFFEEIVDIKFLYGCKVPTIVILYQDSKKGQYVKTYELSMEYKKLTEVKWIPYRGERRVCLLIPVPPPLCGVLVIGRQWIVYCNGSYFKSSQITLSITRAYGRVHAAGDRFLLGDENGILQQLVITHENEIVTNLQITRLGETSVASTISYLHEEVLYIGSRCGDSQLVQLNSEPDAKGSHVQVLDTFTNLGPIVDLCVADPKWNGQSHIVTCSGANKDSSLRVVCNGIGFKEQAYLEELSGFKGLWPLRAATSDSYDKFLVISFLTETRIMSQNPEDELAECDIQGFNSQVQTLFCHTALHNQLIQVTGNSIRLVSSNSDGLRDEWLPPADLSVTAATANTSQVLFAMGQQLVYLEIGDGELIERKRVKLDANISCLNINPIARDSNKSDIAAAGTHQRAVRIYSLPDLNCISAEQLEDCISAEQLEEYIMPCSVLLCSFEETSYLLCALGDGHLLSFLLNLTTGGLTFEQVVKVGNQPAQLRTFLSKEGVRVFAASDRPTIIFSSNKKLRYADVIEEVELMCPFNMEDYPYCLAIAKKDKLAIGRIDDDQRLHIRAIPCQDQVCHISYQEQTRTFATCSVKFTQPDREEHFVHLINDESFDITSTYPLEEDECCFSIVSCSFSDDNNVYYCVGTGYLVEGFEPSGVSVIDKVSPPYPIYFSF